LVVTVLKKAYHTLQSQKDGASGSGYTTSTTATTRLDQQQQPDECEQSYDNNGLVDLTPVEAGIGSSQHTAPHSEDTSSGVNHLQEFIQPSPSCVQCGVNIPPSFPSYEDDKENKTPPPNHTNPASPQSEVPTYSTLDKSPAHGDSILRDRSNATSTSSPRCLKRQRTVEECETEEADFISPIPPKRVKISATSCEGDDSVSTTAEVDRVASLASIVSFGNLARNVAAAAAAAADMVWDGIGKLTLSVSTPDLCSSQAKEDVGVLQQRPFRAMTV
jgi:hypothetical protein